MIDKQNTFIEGIQPLNSLVESFVYYDSLKKHHMPEDVSSFVFKHGVFFIHSLLFFFFFPVKFRRKVVMVIYF